MELAFAIGLALLTAPILANRGLPYDGADWRSVIRSRRSSPCGLMADCRIKLCDNFHYLQQL